MMKKESSEPSVSSFFSYPPRTLAETHTTSGVHCIPVPADFRLCNNLLNSVERTSNTHRSVSWSTKDQSKSKTISCLDILFAILVGYGALIYKENEEMYGESRRQ